MAKFDVPLGVDCLLLLERNKGHMIAFGEEEHNGLFGSAFLLLEFHRWAVYWEKSD